MQHVHKADAQFRYGTWGPAYLLHSPHLKVGVVRLEPGQSMDNHYHAHGEETFLVTQGELTVWLNTTTEHQVPEGGIFECARGEQHLVINNGAQPCEFYFLKTPPVENDTIAVPWAIGEAPLATPPTN